MKIAAVIPAFRASSTIRQVCLDTIPFVDHIYVIDDHCPENSGEHSLTSGINNLTLIRNDDNLGVGGATLAGLKAAEADGFDIAVKVDADGQMKSQWIPELVAPIQNGDADYTKGNRFFFPDHLKPMPGIRLFGNAFLSFFTKLSSGYWQIMDPTNGFIAIDMRVFPFVQPEKIDNRFFFESDMLFRLGCARCVVRDVPFPAVYGEEQSNLSVTRSVPEFFLKNIRNTAKRIIYSYFVRDFNPGSLELLSGILLLLFSLFFGGWHWYKSITTGIPATAGTVMLATGALILGVQFLLAFLTWDMSNAPRQPIGPYTRKPS